MITDKVARFIFESETGDIPEAAFDVARRAVLDFIGVAIAGSREETGNIIAGCIGEMGGGPSSSVIGKGFRTAPHLAALANGTMGHALDYDDLSFMYGAHPSVTLAPVVLAVGEATGASGRDILAAYIIGFEACARISSPIAQSHYMRGWHSTGNIGILGATAAAARLLKLDIPQIKMAYGIAVSMAGGLRLNFGTMTKPFHAGNAASGGTLAAYLARKGFTSRDNAIEAPHGYAEVFGCDEKIDWEKAVAGLGEAFVITGSGIGFKPHPSCGGTLGVTDAAIYLRNKYNIDPSLIEEITLGVGPFENGTLLHAPARGLEGKFSMEYCVCRALLDGKILLTDFTDERVNQAEIQRLIARTNCAESYPMAVMGVAESGLNPQSVKIKTRDGQEYFRETPIIAGMPFGPMTEEQLEEKYRDCASLVLDDANIEKSLSLLKDLKSLDNILELMRAVAGGYLQEGIKQE
jgi:2-methylcitrate dehydratase PrpD